MHPCVSSSSTLFEHTGLVVMRKTGLLQETGAAMEVTKLLHEDSQSEPLQAWTIRICSVYHGLVGSFSGIQTACLQGAQIHRRHQCCAIVLRFEQTLLTATSTTKKTFLSARVTSWLKTQRLNASRLTTARPRLLKHMIPVK